MFSHGRKHEPSHRKTGEARMTGDGEWRGTGGEKNGRRMEACEAGMRVQTGMEGVHGRGELKRHFSTTQARAQGQGNPA